MSALTLPEPIAAYFAADAQGLERGLVASLEITA